VGARVRGDLGIALSDVVGLDAFLRDFDMYFCKLFDGVRHDSGDPFDWGDRMLAHFQQRRVDPRSKVLVFSDGLDIAKVMRLYDYFRGRCQVAFGVGTHLTNDLGPTPLNIVIKMVRCNGQPVAKLGDSPGKSMCATRVTWPTCARSSSCREQGAISPQALTGSRPPPGRRLRLLAATL
jgi:nicotinate phosphoribosyltransferase